MKRVVLSDVIKDFQSLPGVTKKEDLPSGAYFAFEVGDPVKAMRNIGRGIDMIPMTMTGEVLEVDTTTEGGPYYVVQFDEGTILENLREYDLERLGEEELRYQPDEAKTFKLKKLRELHKRYREPGEPAPMRDTGIGYPASKIETIFKKRYWPGEPEFQTMVSIFNNTGRDTWINYMAGKWDMPRDLARRLYKEFFNAATTAGVKLEPDVDIKHKMRTVEPPEKTVEEDPYGRGVKKPDKHPLDVFREQVEKERQEAPFKPERPPREKLREKYLGPRDYYNDVAFLGMASEERVNFLAQRFNKPVDVMKAFYDATFGK